MGNQQERPILSKELIAGLIIGEGSYWIGIAWDKKRDVMQLRPAFSLRMNDHQTVLALEQSLRAHGTSVYRSKHLYDKGRGKPTMQVTVSGHVRMREHLDVFLPLLYGTKKEAASVVSEFVDRRLTLGGTWITRYEEADIEFVERLRVINGPSSRRLDIGILRDYTRRTPRKPGRRRGERSPIEAAA